MGIEAELKARVSDPARVRELLRQRAPEEVAVYSDTYFDTPDRALTRDGRELRVRVVHTGAVVTTVLTYKDPAVDEVSGSKPETETTAADADALRAILAGLGFDVLIAFETIRAVLGELGIRRADETTETHTDAVAARRP